MTVKRKELKTTYYPSVYCPVCHFLNKVYAYYSDSDVKACKHLSTVDMVSIRNKNNKMSSPRYFWVFLK